MSRTVPAAIQTELDTGVVALATCVKITTKDATVYGFTDYQTDLVVDAVTYSSIGGYTASSIKSTSEMNVDNVDLVGYFDANGITLADIRTGALDDAQIEKFKVNPRSVSDGIIKLRAGTLGRGTTGDIDYNLEVRGLFERLQQPIGKVVTQVCRAELFDAECQVPEDPADWTASTAVTANDTYDAGSGSWVSPTTPNGYIYRCITAGTTNDTEGEPTWNTTLGGTTTEADGVEWETVRANKVTGFIITVTDRANFNAPGLNIFPDDYFTNGVIEITAGANDGYSREVKSFTATGGALETFLPFPYDIAAVTAYTIIAGCAKSLADCRDKFANTYNRRAEDYVPGLDKANESPKVR